MEPKVSPEMAKLVVVACVPVAFWKVRFCKVVEPLARILVRVWKPEVRLPIMPVFALKSVVEARPEIWREVVVALVPVAFVKVKFWRVVEALARSCPVKVAMSLEASPKVALS